MKDLCALILAAGQGTRFKSERAKVLHTILGRPMLGYVLDAVMAVKADRIVAVVGHQAKEVEAAFAEANIEFVIQQPQLGTGHAVMQAEAALAGFTGDVLILVGDAPLLTEDALWPLLDEHRQSGAALTLMSMVVEEPHGYGRVIRDIEGYFEKIVEERDASKQERDIDEVNAGFYIAEAGPLFEALREITPDNDQAEYYLTDVPKVMRQRGLEVGIHRTMWPEDLAGINNRAQLVEASAVLRERVNRGLMLEGVTIEHPETTFIQPQVVIEPDVTIAAGVHLTGRTIVKAGAAIGVGAIINDSVIGRGVEVRPYSVVDGAEAGAGAIIGPYARLRPGTKIEAGALVGNFVEVKDSTIGDNTRAAHLSFIGDAEIGSKVNIGAGTVLANWDGTDKHVTNIEDEVKVGANATLIAPVTIGRGSEVAGGSTITDDVPKGKLAIGRGRQVNKDRK